MKYCNLLAATYIFGYGLYLNHAIAVQPSLIVPGANSLCEHEEFSPTAIAISPDGKRLVLTDQENGSVLILSTETGALERSVAVQSQTYGVAFGHSNNIAYVVSRKSGEGAIQLFDIDSGIFVASIPIGRGAPSQISISQDGERAYITFGVSSKRVAAIDLGSRRIVDSVNFADRSDPGAVGLSRSNAYVIDSRGRIQSTNVKNNLAGEMPITFEDGKATRMTISPSGNLMAVSVVANRDLISSGRGWIEVVSTFNHTSRFRIGLDGEPDYLAFSPDNRLLFAVLWHNKLTATPGYATSHIEQTQMPQILEIDMARQSVKSRASIDGRPGPIVTSLLTNKAYILTEYGLYKKSAYKISVFDERLGVIGQIIDVPVPKNKSDEGSADTRYKACL